MYEQTLYKIIEPIKLTTIHRLNKGKKWKFGYNKDHDIIVLSKNGQIGDIYDIQGLKIALPNLQKTFIQTKIRNGSRLKNPIFLKKSKLYLTGEHILKSKNLSGMII